ncbi:hypothetical protein BDP27DRAFT_1363087 [Rhodocollybia butyracea]|uniref:Uncharacterized protein n=1 Tax=Rhodocollybia butyracea TaxID=206335 RepID=A0A9P5PUT6_9AGAR|nr:hypothetical protein BDP27DRAFT_1363087 [Rhodocollybia butyracea]
MTHGRHWRKNHLGTFLMMYTPVVRRAIALSMQRTGQRSVTGQYLLENVDDSESISLQNVDEVIRHGFVGSNWRYPIPPDSMSSMSSMASTSGSPVFEYSRFNDDDMSSPQTLAQDLNLPSLFLRTSLLLRSTNDSSALPHYDPSWQSLCTTSEAGARASQSPLLSGSAGVPTIASSGFMMSPASKANSSGNSQCQTMEELILPKPRRQCVNKGGGKLIVGYGAHPATQGDILRRRRNAQGRFECPIPHCGKSYTANHNLQNFTGSRAHKRHMRNKNVCPTSPFAGDLVPSRVKKFSAHASLRKKSGKREHASE